MKTSQNDKKMAIKALARLFWRIRDNLTNCPAHGLFTINNNIKSCMIVGFEPAISRIQIMNRSYYATSVSRYTGKVFKCASYLCQTSRAANPTWRHMIQTFRVVWSNLQNCISNLLPTTANLDVFDRYESVPIQKSVLRRRMGVHFGHCTQLQPCLHAHCCVAMGKAKPQWRTALGD